MGYQTRDDRAAARFLSLLKLSNSVEILSHHVNAVKVNVEKSKQDSDSEKDGLWDIF